MKPQMISRSLFCGIVFAAVSGGRLWAQEPPKDAAPTARHVQNSTQVSTAVFLTESSGGNLNLVTTTYGNALGVEIADVDAALRTQLGLEEGAGVVVTGVNKESEAAKAGLARFDLVLKAGGQPIGNPKQFHDLVARQQGKSVTFNVLRKGKPAAVAIKLPDTPVFEFVDSNLTATQAGIRWLTAATNEPVKVEQQYRIGVQLAEADDALRSQLRLAAGEGLVVTDVVADSPAARAGIQNNDVLTKFDGKRLKTVEAVSAQIQEVKDRKVSVTLFRGGNEIFCDVTPMIASDGVLRLSIVGELDGLIRLREAERALRFVVEVQPDGQAKAAVRPTAAEQIANLKNQLAEMQKSLAALEAALAAAPEEKPAAPEEKK